MQREALFLLFKVYEESRNFAFIKKHHFTNGSVLMDAEKLMHLQLLTFRR